MRAMRFYQRKIMSFECDGSRIVGARLSCGHVQPCTARSDASKRKTMPCHACGYAPRRAWERAVVEAHRDKSLDDALAHVETRAAIGRIVALAPQILATPPITPQQRALWERLDGAVRDAKVRRLRADVEPGA